MRLTLLFSSLALYMVTLLGTPALAESGSDQAKETRWREQIVDSLMVGEVVDLDLKGKTGKILGLFTPATDPRQGGLIVLHGSGVHPNWPDIIHPVRTELPEFGWSTLSIQLPVLANDARHAEYAPLFDEVPARISAAVGFLKSKGINNIIIIGHSLGAVMASYYLSSQTKTGVRAFIGIGMSSSKTDPKMDASTTLAKIKIPVLDLYGSRDLDSVLASAKQRVKAGKKAQNKYYFQKQIMGADHFMRDKEGELLKRIRGWLKRYAGGVEIQLK
ncbi:MAG: alpha/beta hydrolase family protein [Gammaproteobacteria bacterium]|nr:alpha/beta hydrolase family protein [Gammaproteobacteria bacterium]